MVSLDQAEEPCENPVGQSPDGPSADAETGKVPGDFSKIDGGGANGVRCRAWKAFVQTHLADRFRLPVTVCHYPPGTSKWNPIEHRLFSEISKNWRGKPLDSYETIVKYIRTTKTATGLRVRAQLVKKGYKKGVKISKAQFSALSIERHETLSQWNYTLLPR